MSRLATGLFKPKTTIDQDRCDTIQAEARHRPGDRIRRGALSPLPALISSDDLIDRRIAEELDYCRRVLVAIGERLVSDNLVVARHASTLQSFDVIAQMLGYLGNVVGAADRELAIDRIGMEDLRSRIRRRSLAEDDLAR